MIGSIFTAIRSIMAAFTVSADAAAGAAQILKNVTDVGVAQSEQWLLESLEDSDISVEEFLKREPLRVRLEREAQEAKAAARAMRLAAPKP